jgi:hypothetical protein
MRKFGLTILLVLIGAVLLAARAQAQQFGGTTYCNASAVYDAGTNGSTVLVASSSGTGGGIYVCGYTMSSINAVNVKLVYGTGTKCGTGTTSLTPAYQFQASTAGLASWTAARTIGASSSRPAMICASTRAPVRACRR